jgi:hypothetical protein
MVEQPSETMLVDVRQAFDDAVRLYIHWKSGTFNVPAPTLNFRALTISLSGICDLIAAYKNELAIDPSYTTGARVLDALIQKHRMASGRGGADTSQATLALGNRPSFEGDTSDH